MRRKLPRGPYPTKAERTRYCQQCGSLAVIEHETRDGWICDECLFSDGVYESLDLSDFILPHCALGDAQVATESGPVDAEFIRQLDAAMKREGIARSPKQAKMWAMQGLNNHRARKVAEIAPYPRRAES